MKTTREVYALFDIAKDVGPALWMRTREGMPEHQVNEMLEGHPDYPRKRVTVIREEFQMKEQCVSSAGHVPTLPPCSEKSEVIDWIIGFLEDRIQEIDLEFPELKDWMPSPVRAVEGAIRREEVMNILESLKNGNF